MKWNRERSYLGGVCLGLLGIAWDIVDQLMAAVYCAFKPTFLVNVIKSGSHRWKVHHYQLMKNKPKRPSLRRSEASQRLDQTCGLRISDEPTSDNLTPQETTNQDAAEVGADGAALSCPGSSVVANGEVTSDE